MTVLEIVNLLTIGMTCFNARGQVPSDILEGNQYIPSTNLKSQNYLDDQLMDKGSKNGDKNKNVRQYYSTTQENINFQAA